MFTNLNKKTQYYNRKKLIYFTRSKKCSDGSSDGAEILQEAYALLYAHVQITMSLQLALFQRKCTCYFRPVLLSTRLSPTI